MSWNSIMGFWISQEDGPLTFLLFISLFVPELSSDPKAFLFTINMETWLFTLVHSLSCMRYQSFPSLEEAWKTYKAWPVTQAPVKSVSPQV